jgi:hypothetical protein
VIYYLSSFFLMFLLQMTSLVLAETAQIDILNRTVVLPRVCSWYLRDFCLNNNSTSYSSNNSSGNRNSTSTSISLSNSNSKLLSLKSSSNSSSSTSIGSSAALPIHCVRVIVPYLRETDRNVLIGMLQDGLGSINIRFRPYSFRSRLLQKYDS